MGLLSALWNGVQRLGTSGVWRRVADTSKSIAVGAARFVGQHHAPLALLAKSIGDQSGNPYLQGAGNAAVAGSTMYAMRQRLDRQNAAAGAARAAAGRPDGVYNADTGRVD